MRQAITVFLLVFLLGCSAEPEGNSNAAKPLSAKVQFEQKYPMHRVKGFAARIGPAPFGDEMSVAKAAIKAAGHPCSKVSKAIRNDGDGSVTAKCTNGERYNIITAEGIDDPVVMRCSAVEEFIQQRVGTCHVP